MARMNRSARRTEILSSESAVVNVCRVEVKDQEATKPRLTSCAKN